MTNPKIAPAFYSTADAKARIACGHTHLYSLIATGKLEAVKMGTKTLITAESVEAFIAGLPRATIGSAARRTARAA